MFIGRKNEIKSLKSAVAKTNGIAKILVLTGRRRVGKSALIEHFCQKQSNKHFYKLIGMPPKKQNRTKLELANLATQMTETFNIPKPVLNDWDDALFAIGKYVEHGNCILMIDEINWFGKTHGDISSSLFTLWENKLKNIKGFTLIFTGSLAGWIKDNFSEDTAWYGRLSWESVLQPIPMNDALEFIPSLIRQRLTINEQIRYLLISGGIPSYLLEFDFSENFEDNLKRSAYSSSGYLFREFSTLMTDLFRTKGKRIEQILYILSKDKCSAEQIAHKLKLEKANGHLYKDLDMMEQSAFIRSVKPWNLAKGTFNNRDAIFYISDPYIRFYFKGILPHTESIKSGCARLPDNLDSLLGFQFEYVMRENLNTLCKALALESKSILRFAPYQIKGLQIDILIETRRYFYIVELKFCSAPLDSRVVRDMKQKLDRFKCPANKSVKTAVIHVNGASDNVQNSDYIDICENLSDHL